MSNHSHVTVPQESPCHFNPAGVGATCSGYITVTTGSELALQETVANIGPVAVAIDVYTDFWSYKSGECVRYRQQNKNTI